MESRSDVELVTTTLSLSPDYQRAPMPCSQCGSASKLATRAA